MNLGQFNSTAVALCLWSLAGSVCLGQGGTTCGNPPVTEPPPCPPTGFNKFSTYSGSVHREITDLRVDGAVGEIPLNFKRTSTSRWDGAPYWPFGSGGNWKHSYYWNIVYEGTNAHGAVFHIDAPDGASYDFQKFSGTDSYFIASWSPTDVASHVHQRVEHVTTNEFALWHLDGHRLAFYTNITGAVTSCVPRGVYDRHNNFFSFTVDSSNRVTRVTEPAGRYLEIRYGLPTGINGSGNQQVITNIQASTGLSVDYVYGTITNGTCGASCVYTTLKEARYGDGSTGVYSYVAAKADGTGQPLLASADDPRYAGPATRMKYTYNADLSAFDVQGFIYQEKSLVTDAVLAQLNVTTNETGFRTVITDSGTTNTITLSASHTGAFVDSLGRTNRYLRYDSGKGMLSDTIDALGRTNHFDRTAHFGNVRVVRNADGSQRVMTFTSDAKPFFIATLTNELNQVTRYTYGAVPPATNLITRIDHPDTSYETFTYNSYGQRLTHRLRNGGIISNFYSATGLLLTNRNPLGHSTIFTYDNTNRVATVTDPRGNTTTFQYNARGLVTKVTHPDASFLTYAYDTYGNQTNLVNELGQSWKSKYDEYNRLVTTTDPLSRVTSNAYATAGGCGCGAGGQSKVTSVTDPAGKKTVFVYDAEWQLIATTNALGHATTWTYDAVGNRKTQTDANGNLYTWVYDSRNRVIAETNALSQATTFKYDALGNRTNRVDGAAISTFWTYDTMQRVTTTGSGTLTYQYLYDLGGRRTGMVTKVNGVVTESTGYTYDVRDLLLTKTDPTGHTLTYGYDATGNRTNLLVAQASPLVEFLNQFYAYDNRNRVTNMTANGKSTTFAYDAASRLIAQVLPNGTTVTNGFDNAHQLLSRVHKKTDATTIASFLYGYDSSGNRTNMTTLEGVNAYSYNSNNWLTAATYPGGSSQQFFYDSVGNRTNLVQIVMSSTNSTVYLYNGVNGLTQSITGGTTNTFTYDASGQLTNQSLTGLIRSFSYSFRSQMTALVDTNGVVSSFDFDGDGHRVKQGVSGCLATRFVYDGPDVVLDLNESNQVVYVYVNGLSIDDKVERLAYLDDFLSVRLVFHSDALGSVVAISDSTQSAVKTYRYEAFGRILSESGALAPNRYTFTSREMFSASSELLYYRWRVYSSSIGRFTSEDPLGFTDGPNVALYANADPVNAIDPDGLAYATCKLLKQWCTSKKQINVWFPYGWQIIKVCTQRKCKWRCYHASTDNCPSIPCPNNSCPLDHGVEILKSYGPDPSKPYGAAPLCSEKTASILASGS